jgi:hypothetical protein
MARQASETRIRIRIGNPQRAWPCREQARGQRAAAGFKLEVRRIALSMLAEARDSQLPLIS